MTVSSSFTDKVYSISGTTTRYPWNQDLDEQYGTLVVTEETAISNGEVVQTYVEGTDYNIVNQDVIFVTAPSDTSHYIRITRNTYKGQPVVFNEGEDFPAEDFENSLDRLAMVAQELVMADSKEKTARENADTDLQNQITAEVSRATGVEGNLSNLATAVKTNLVSAINEAVGVISTINNLLATYGDVVTHDVSEFATAAQGAKADTAVQPSDVGNGTITIIQGGITRGTFTTNQSGDTAINLTSGTNTPSNKYAAISVTFPANTSSVEVDVSSVVDSDILYVPYVYVDTQYSETLQVNAAYVKATKLLKLFRESSENSLTFTAYVVFIASDNQSGTSAVGCTNGQFYIGYNRSYSKDEDDALLAAKQGIIDSSHKLSADLVDDTSTTNKFVTASEKSAIGTALQPADIDNMQTTANLVTSVSSSSTDSQYPSALCLYNLVGDIETLINAL